MALKVSKRDLPGEREREREKEWVECAREELTKASNATGGSGKADF